MSYFYGRVSHVLDVNFIARILLVICSVLEQDHAHVELESATTTLSVTIDRQVLLHHRLRLCLPAHTTLVRKAQIYNIFTKDELFIEVAPPVVALCALQEQLGQLDCRSQVRSLRPW
jgi:hypothetical protein